jgi:hypothetical protein
MILRRLGASGSCRRSWLDLLSGDAYVRGVVILRSVFGAAPFIIVMESKIRQLELLRW